MEAIAVSLPAPAFHPGSLSQGSYSYRSSQRVSQTRRRIYTTVPNPQPLDWNSKKPDLLKNFPGVPVSYQMAYHHCGMSLQKRNEYLQKFKKDMLTFRKNYSKDTKNVTSQPFLFEGQFQELRQWMRKEHLLRNSFRKILYKWLAKKYHTRLLNTEDPSTLCEPEVPVKIYDSKSRGLYTFEAASMKRQVDAQLGNSKWMFPEPSLPRNPLTNMEFNLGQMIVLYQKLKATGNTTWMLESLVAQKYDINTFLTVNKTPLKLHGLEDLVKHPESEDLCEFMEEFIEDEYDHHRLRQKGILVTLYWALANRYTHPYIKSWHLLFRDYYKNLILYGGTYYTDHINELNGIHARSRKLLLSPDVTVLAEERLASLPKKEAPPPTSSMVSVVLRSPQEQHMTSLLNIEALAITSQNENQSPLAVTINWNTFVQQIENFLDSVDGDDTPPAND